MIALAVLFLASFVVAFFCTLAAIACGLWMIVKIITEPKVERVARAVARERWSSALRRYW